MSNKKNQEKTTKWMQVGSYELGIEKSATGNMLVCRSVAKNWSVRWRDDTLMFGMMLTIMKSENAREYLHSLLTMMFVTTTYTHDLIALCEKQEMPFMEGIAELIQKQNEYEASLKPQPTEEEEKQSLEEMKHMAEVAEEMMNIGKEEKKDESDQVHTEGA